MATAVAGSRDVIAPGRTGVLVPPADPEALARALIGLLSDPAGATALGLAARSVVLEEYTAERMVAVTTGVYERVAEGR
ncbi:MAG: hypothetical protein HYU66_27805 [Armatimonadetes bacterium]|nr:hypothetical protein [Armatimonadota bacterium]